MSDEGDTSSDEEMLISKKRKTPGGGSSKKKGRSDFNKRSFIDDSAVLSGEEDNDDEEEEEDDENENDYDVGDGFVVDEVEEVDRPRKQRGDLEDSDDDDEDDEEDDDNGYRRRIRRIRQSQELDDDDLDLINEAKGISRRDRDERVREYEDEEGRVRARNEDDLEQNLFDDYQEAPKKKKKKGRVEVYDEDGMDDFIDDDIGDQDRIMSVNERKEGGVNEAQLAEASEIFGTDYLEYMQEEDKGEEDDDFGAGSKYREKGYDSDEGSEDDDLFEGDNEERQSKKERRQQHKMKKIEKSRKELRKNFEPVQLIENFCTQRDDEIRNKDLPERFFDWSNSFDGPIDGSESFTDEEEEEAMWIMNKVNDIANELITLPSDIKEENRGNVMEERQRNIMSAIIHALRYMRRDHFEPAFIKRYRADVIASEAVRNNLYQVLDADAEWDRLTSKRTAVEDILSKVVSVAESFEAKGVEENNVLKLKDQLRILQEKLDDTVKQEKDINIEIEKGNDDDDDDDDLFDDNDDEKTNENKEQLKKHLETVQSLLQDRAERVAQLSSQLQAAEIRNEQSLANQGLALNITKKMSCENLWNVQDYEDYLSTLTDECQIEDMKKFLSLLREGNDAIRKRETLEGEILVDSNERKRSRSVNNDLYRSRVAEGMRSIVYQFMLSPFRAGMKLEQIATGNKFDHNQQLPGEKNNEDSGYPARWTAPKVKMFSPAAFANNLVSSGELIQITTNTTDDMVDPLSGCRFVSAMEIAYEPRIRNVLRNIFRARALLTTRPTKKGEDNFDAFSEYYGLHLIKGKPIRDHFPVDEKERETRKMMMNIEEGKEYDKEMERKEKESCLQYLRILEAEHFGHISVHVHMPYKQMNLKWYKEKRLVFGKRENQQINPLLDKLEEVFIPDDGDTDEWNKERSKILELGLMKFILPELEQEARRDLRETAVKYGIFDAGANLREMAMEGPYRPTALIGENRFIYPTDDLPMVGVCCSTDNREATYLASVTRRGQLNDHLAIASGQRIDDHKVRKKVIDFLIKARPAAVLIGTSGGFSSRFLSRRLGELIVKATEKWNNREIQGVDEDDEEFESRRMEYGYNDDEYEQWKCNVELIDDSVPQLFGRSVRSKKEFPEKEVNLKCAIAIARQGKDPLSELTYAWNVASDVGIFGTEMFYLNIHPLQRLLPKNRLLRQYERVLCEAVADVGVDINCACSYDHLLGSLSFVSGMGPRKAANLKQNFARLGGAIAKRIDILKKRYLGPVVYNNAVAFLRIREIEQLPNQDLHPLDNTRLHPDVYHRQVWAVKIAIDALERVENNNKDEENFKMESLKIVMENSKEEVERLFNATKMEWEQHYGPTFNVAGWDPRNNVPSHMWKDKVEELDLDAFARMIENSGQGKWDSHLQMIKWEFRLPYEDPRKPMAPLNGDKLFRLIAGESDSTLRKGIIRTGKVIKNGEYGSRVKLEGDISAFIPLRYLADKHVVSSDEIVNVGQVVTAVITEVKKEHFTVDMSMRMEDIKKLPSTWERPLSLLPLDEDYFDMGAAQRIEQEKQAKRDALIDRQNENVGTPSTRPKPGRQQRRACAHPAFRNAKHNDVDRELKESGEIMVGEALIRPSLTKTNNLAVHWVVKLGSIKLIEVQECEKDTEASIGKKLKVKEHEYGSIDELLGRHISPMNDHVESLVNHRKFKDLPEDKIEEELVETKRRSPEGVFYHLCWMEGHPGYASLRFILSQSIKQYTIGITPGGFSLGSKVYPKLDLLLNDFKKNPRGMTSSRSRIASSSFTSRSTQHSGIDSNRQNRLGQASRPRPPPPTSVVPPRPHPPPFPQNFPPPPPNGHLPPPGRPPNYGQPPPPPPPAYNMPPPPSGPPPRPPYGAPPRPPAY